MNKNDIRHKTLSILAARFYKISEEQKGKDHINKDDMDVPVTEIKEILKITEHEFKRACIYLVQRDEIEYVANKRLGKECCTINPKGLDVFEEEKYRKLKYAERNDNIHSYARWILPGLAIILSLIALYQNIFTEKKKDSIKIYLQVQGLDKKTTLKLDSVVHGN